MKLRHLLGLSTTILLFTASFSYGNTHDWGTEGISDTTKADSVFQLTAVIRPIHTMILLADCQALEVPIFILIPGTVKGSGLSTLPR